MEWLFERTISKVPGLFASQFWQHLLPQACASHPVILHAALALASAHESAVTQLPGTGGLGFTIEQYNRAVTHLIPMTSALSKSTVRVVLISCLIFASIDFLQKRYKSGQIHVQSGYRVMREIVGCDLSGVSNDPNSNLIDLWLAETFEKFYIQEIFLAPDSPLHIWPREGISKPAVFQSATQARVNLDKLLLATYSLTRFHPPRRGRHSVTSLQHFASMKQQLQQGLSLWLQVATLSSPSNTSEREVLSYRLLYIYHMMAYILVESAAKPPNEVLFDQFSHEFESIVTRVKELLKVTAPITAAHETERKASHNFSFITDIGIIPPLYFVAVKCRVWTTRCQAIGLLADSAHQEGVWNGAIAAAAASEIMKLEGQRCVREKVVYLKDGLCSQQIVRHSRRLYGVSLEMPNGPERNAVLLKAYLKRTNGSWHLLTRDVYLVARTEDQTTLV